MPQGKLTPEQRARQLKGIRKYLAGRVMTEAQRNAWKQNLPKALKKAQSPEARAKRSASVHKAYVEGRVRLPTAEVLSARGRLGRSHVDEQKLIEANRRTARARVGTPNPPGPSAKGIGHWKARWWKIRSERGIVYEFKNLNQFVREHPGLFDPVDVIWGGKSKTRCRATHGIAALFHQRINGPTSWKGWTAVLPEHPADDPLGRDQTILFRPPASSEGS